MPKQRPLSECLEQVRRLPHYAETDFDTLLEQLGEDHLCKRLNRQLDLYESHRKEEGAGDLRWQRKVMRTLVRLGLKSTGLYERARANARSPVVVENVVLLADLPDSFDGYRILHLGDFHFEFIPELPEVLNQALQDVKVDACVLTGDFRGETTGPYEESLQQFTWCRAALGDPVYGILGNHDNIEFLHGFHELGIHPLMNTAVPLEKEGERIWLCGVDDPQHYGTHDLATALPEEARQGVSILLSHTPEICREAAEAGFSAMWCGHTHGGQICLPGGIPVIGHLGGAPRACIRGAWTVGELQGYTTRGVGCSTLDVRLNCPPEITVHTLRKG